MENANLDLLNWDDLYLLELKHPLTDYIDFLVDFFDRYKSNYICFDYKQSKYLSSTVKIIVYYKKAKKK